MCRNPSTMLIFIARINGKTEEIIPATKVNENASARVVFDIRKMGKSRENISTNAGTNRNAESACPIPPPMSAMRIDSPAINVVKCLVVNPNVFNTAYSRMRSRADITIVFARTSNKMPMITNETN